MNWVMKAVGFVKRSALQRHFFLLSMLLCSVLCQFVNFYFNKTTQTMSRSQKLPYRVDDFFEIPDLNLICKAAVDMLSRGMTGWRAFTKKSKDGLSMSGRSFSVISLQYCGATFLTQIQLSSKMCASFCSCLKYASTKW